MRVAIVGAGPIGLEAAARLLADGHDVSVYEAGEPGAAVRTWAHIRMFTPWSMSTTARGRALVGTPELDDPTRFPFGQELVDRYLAPLARHLPIHAHHRVIGVSRTTLKKAAPLGARRASDAFRLMIEGPRGEMDVVADAVIDCTGVFGDRVPTGAGGLPALGERNLGPGRLLHAPAHVEHLGGKRVLVIGDGASACTALVSLQALDPAPAITWLGRAEAGPAFVSPAEDPLPDRRALYLAARAAKDEVRHLVGVVIQAYVEGPNGVEVRLSSGETLIVDHIVACCGFRPDLNLTRELQVHHCYASEAPMKLAAALQPDGDCLTPKASGADLLVNPEPRFFVLGNKSYGRRGDFLLADGFRQVEEVASLLA